MAKKKRKAMPPKRTGSAKIVKSNPMAHGGNCTY